jgi:hypothetical protein
MNATVSRQPSGEEETVNQPVTYTSPGNTTSSRLFLAILLCVGFFSLVHVGLAVERSILSMRPFLSHDEAEHLQVAFQLKLGERPYVDFIENHPMLFNHMLNAAFDLIAARTTRHQFLVAKILIYAHFFICFGIISLVLRRILDRKGFSPPPAILPLISLGCLAPWASANTSIWEVRPDWLCHAYAVLCVYHHWRAHEQNTPGGPSMARLLTAAVLGGLGTAILPKTILVFLPYAIVVLTSPGLRRFLSDTSLRLHFKRLILANAAFVLVFLLTLAGCVVLDLRLSQVSLRDYWIANMTINSIPHLAYVPFINDFSNPIQRIMDLLRFGALVFLGLSALFSQFTGFTLPIDDKSNARRLCLRMALVTVIISVILPTFTNRSVWPQYFSPALLALILLTSLAIDKVFTRIIPTAADAARRFSPLAAARAPFSLAAVAGLILLYQTAGRVIWSDRPFQKIISQEAGYHEYYGRIDFLPDLFMPTNLTYWIFDPQTIPVHGRRWGYFFMLSRDRQFWNDVDKFGLTANPERIIQKSFLANPPDVITLADECDFVNRCHILMLSNSIRLDWLWPILQKDYLRASRMGLNVLIHARHAKRFQSLWWTLTPLAETLDVIQLKCYTLPNEYPNTFKPMRFTSAVFH